MTNSSSFFEWKNAEKMSMIKYDVDIAFELNGIFLLFKNRLLMYPGIDYIIEEKGSCDGMCLVFDKRLLKGDQICIVNNDFTYYYECKKDGKLVDKSTDKIGFVDRYKKFIW